MANIQVDNLQGANLTWAILREAILSGANLRDAKYDKNTKFPENFNPEEAEMVLVE